MTARPAPARLADTPDSVSTEELRQRITAQLEEARARTLLLIEPLTDDDLVTQHDPLMSPIIWDLGHIANFGELWLTRNLEGPIEFGEMPGLYNPFQHPPRERGALELPSRAAIVAEMQEIRQRDRERLAAVDLDSDNPLLPD